MPASKSPGPRVDRVVTVKLTDRLHAQALAVLDVDRGETFSAFARLAIAELTARRHRDALRAQTDSRTGATTGRAPLEPYDAPEPSKDRK